MNVHEFTLDYIEETGPVTRVGLFATIDIPDDEATAVAIREAAVDLSGLSNVRDVNVHGYRVEVTFEHD